MKYIKLFTGTRCQGWMGSTTTDGKNHVLFIGSGTPTEPKHRITVNYALRIVFASFKNLQICFVLNRVIFLCPNCGIRLCFVTTGPNITFYPAMNASFTVVWHMCLLYLHFIHWFDKVNLISTFFMPCLSLQNKHNIHIITVRTFYF